MAIRKCRVKRWALKLNDGRELAKIRGKSFSAAYIDCSKCYERVNHKVAATAAINTGCDPAI
eukprot:14292851-Heterocapsa_arctica.AAC.1